MTSYKMKKRIKKNIREILCTKINKYYNNRIQGYDSQMETNIIKMMGPADAASLLNAVSGMLAIIAAYYQQPIYTALLLLLAVFFDAIDGSLARRFPTSTKDIFGETMDSLADVISFGIAPAIIIFELYQQPPMIIASLLLLCCGILRLSRYNTIITEQEGPTTTFIGLPIPVSSFMLSLMLLSQLQNHYIVLVMMAIIALLMISSFKYPKIKNKALLGVCAVLLIPTVLYPINNSLMNVPSLTLILFVIGYMILPIINIDI